MPIAEIHLEHPSLVLSPAIRSVPAARISREFQPVGVRHALVLFFSVEGNSPDDLDGFDAALERDPTVSTPRLIADLDRQRVYRVHLTDRAVVVTPTLAELGIQILDAHSDDGGWVLKLQMADLRPFTAFRRFCESRDVSITVRQLYHENEATPGTRFGLTAAQREALELAFRAGYFDEPRATSLEELGAQLGISPAATGRRLRRGTANLLEHTVV
ncbi:helix-turn-helix domain-containing protein [Halomarina pelagica]|uniref:helix-turn-helix domain-containing protein n=1 Tax=Halomarina pelagica TaxID=2961599 RepID=UPI0020C5954C|nr:helix-turn-helix domain-containing protein [Halomarina sp. BND7]